MRTIRSEHRRSMKILWTAIGIILVLGICTSAGGGQAAASLVADHGRPGPGTGMARPHGEAPTAAPRAPALPFVAGEALSYAVRVGNLAAGRGTMWVDGPVDARGTETLLLRSHMRAGVGPLRGSGRTESWLDTNRMASLRFEKEERRLFSRHTEAVEVYPDERRWTAADGRAGTTPTGAPLDELSFIYFLRTLPLPADTAMSFDRHFEAGRNPVAVQVVGRESISSPAGTFAAVVVEMRVRDPRHYAGEGVIRIHLTDDACRLPIRIESTLPGVGRTVLTLESVVHPEAHCSAHGAGRRP